MQSRLAYTKLQFLTKITTVLKSNSLNSWKRTIIIKLIDFARFVVFLHLQQVKFKLNFEKRPRVSLRRKWRLFLSSGLCQQELTTANHKWRNQQASRSAAVTRPSSEKWAMIFKKKEKKKEKKEEGNCRTQREGLFSMHALSEDVWSKLNWKEKRFIR